MALSKKQIAAHFAAQIESLKDHRASNEIDQPRFANTYNNLLSLAGSMAVSFALDNPRFDRERFLKACGF